MPELQPCPFCGKDAQIAPDEIGSGGQHVPPYHAGCLRGAGCGIAFTADDPDEAVAEWNRRALSTVTPVEAGGLVERLRDMGGGDHAVATCQEAAAVIEAQAAELAAKEEARAIAERLSIHHSDVDRIAIIATALSAKDAELARQIEVRDDAIDDLQQKWWFQSDRADRAEAQLAEARKALVPDAYEVRCTDGNYEWRRPYHGELEVIMSTGRDRSGKPFEYRALFADAPASRGATPAEVGGLVGRLQERATVMEALSPDFASACREAASLIQSQAAESAVDKARIAGLEAGLEEAKGTLDWAARRMKGNCAGSDVSAVMLSAGRAAALLNGERKG